MSEPYYPKIHTLLERDPRSFKVTDELRFAEFNEVNYWDAYEKIHGRNVRVKCVHGLSGYSPRWGGRTDKSEFSKVEMNTLWSIFNDKSLTKALLGYTSTYLLFGELYGPPIEDGGNYRGDISFRLFDVFVPDPENKLGGWWLEQDNIRKLADRLGVDTAPFIGIMTIEEIIAFVQSKPASRVAQAEGGNPEYMIEGVVARTAPLLFNRKGERLMFKLKCRDF